MNDSILDIRDLKVIYKTDIETVYAVNGISFSLQKGETLGIVGETGAGKSTTALSILRLLPERTGKIVEGSINFKDKSIIDASESEMRDIRGEKISMIFQDPMTSLNPIITIGEQISETLMLHNKEGKSKEEINARTDEVLEMVGILPERKKDYPHQFSGGMKQRVVIAMALACEPSLLIADEPTTALDVTIQAQVLAMMRSLRDRLGTSMIMITHDLGIIAQTCDKVAIMYAGEFIETGTLEDIFTSEYHHPYTVGLFGSIPNLKEKTHRLSPVAGLMPDPTKLPDGCYFSPRCPKCFEKCTKVHPVDHKIGTNTIKCHLFDKEVYNER
ncbi:MAG: ABC transporter ATP-binding protein [Clostridiaceae bacterium]|nr:ABC transporter ATP-binding protein [Clostridiaceae bacterium]